MADEKRKVSDEIINIISTEAVSIASSEEQSQKDKFDKALAEYKTNVEYTINSKIASIANDEDKKRNRVESELRFEIQKKLRDRRTTLLKELELSLRQKINESLATPSYKTFIKDCVALVNKEYALQDMIVILREEDASLLDSNVRFETSKLPLGGCIIDVKNKRYDFTMESRLEDAMKDFIANSNLWI